MSTTFPTTIDDFTDVTCGDSRNPKDVVNNLQDAVEAIENKLGYDGDTNQNSHDYKLSGVTGSDKAASLAGSETLTNKTLTAPAINSPVINSGATLTATSTELNYNDITTPGIAEATKALITDANKDINLGTGDITATNLTSSGSLSITDVTGSWDGWIDAGETWTYASAADPVFTFTIAGDVTSKYKAGLKIKLNQTTDKYFIVAKDSTYSNPNTTVTVYGGTDYDLANETISNPQYSFVHGPIGFPLDESKWSVTLINDTANNVRASVTSETWFNGGGSGLSGSVPIGLWKVRFYLVVTCTRTATSTTFSFPAGRITLSTANNTESDATLTIPVGGGAVTGFANASYGAVGVIDVSAEASGLLSVSSAATYYLNCWFSASGTLTNGGFRGDISPTRVKLVCAYL